MRSRASSPALLTGSMLPRLMSVVIAELGHEKRVLRDFVKDPVFFVDAARPVATEAVLQWLGLADSRERGALDFLDQWVDRAEHLLVRLLPVKIILPGMLGENELHSMSSLSRPPPCSSSTTDSSKRRAFFGARTLPAF